MKVFFKLHREEIKRKIEQNLERGVPASQRMVRRPSLGAELFPW
ncbi:MAG: hypothetical protein M5U10_00930 [Candidatus Methanoperedens sp.]|nr:hypothetical protein [Candidatus Methanoperedens nitroreducens]MDJ1420456.1 hypothetical protein [Candidatus Methanoperedens sp.]